MTILFPKTQKNVNKMDNLNNKIHDFKPQITTYQVVIEEWE
jgi:hypothetical protein